MRTIKSVVTFGIIGLFCLVAGTGMCRESRKMGVVYGSGLTPAVPPARLSTEGHLVITAPRSEVFVPMGAFVELALPQMGDRPGLIPVQTYLVTNERYLNKTDLLDRRLNSYRIYGFQRGEILPKRLRAGVLDDRGHSLELMQCVLRPERSGRTVSLLAEKRGEYVRLTVPEIARLGTVYLFQGDVCLGSLSGKSGVAFVDAGSLPAGTVRFHAVATAPDGTLISPCSASLTLSSRYEISTLEEALPVRVPRDQPALALPFRVVLSNPSCAVRTRVYLNGEPVAESGMSAFEFAVPLRDAPTGNSHLEVVGVREDGQTYPVERMTFAVKNEAWEQHTLSTPAYRDIEGLLKTIKTQEQEGVYWISRLLYDPPVNSLFGLRQTPAPTSRLRPGNYLTMMALNSLQTSIRNAEYRANAQRAIILMAQSRLEAGRLYRQLKMIDRAQSCFQRALREAGEGSPTGRSAQAELRGMEEKSLSFRR